jgi:cardiolipin synthase
LPDTGFLSDRHAVASARFKSASGPITAQRSARILAELQRKSGDLDILDRQLALEQAIVGSALVLGNKVALLQDGPATYEAMFAAMRGAKDSINLESYIIEGGVIGQQFADLLLERHAQGVKVNVIYDSVGALGTPRAFFERMASAGIQILEFNPINPLFTRTPWAPNHRDHRKLLVVDGRIAFIGGINISSVYSSGSSVRVRRDKADQPTGWRDTDIQIEGPVVAEFQSLFLQTWERQRGAPLVHGDYFPVLQPAGQEMVRAIGSTPDDPYSLIYLTLISAITNAEKQIHLANAYFVPDPQLVDALLDAARRGVKVTLILPAQSDSSSTLHAGRSHYTRLLAAGIRIYERRGAFLHVKAAIVDGVWSCVGSSNLDWRSALDNDEVNAVILGRGFAAQMLTAFTDDMAASDEISLEAWERRPLGQRLREWSARLLERLL